MSNLMYIILGSMISGGTTIESEIDSEMSDTSENAVKNKAIKTYVDTSLANIQAEIGDMESVLSSVVEVTE